MSLFTPGQFRSSLQKKIKEMADPVPQSQEQSQGPVTIKNNSHESFTQQASTYAANEMRQINSSVQSPRSTATLPTGSFINKSVRERMQTMVKEQRGGK